MKSYLKTFAIAGGMCVALSSMALAGPVEDRKELMESVGKAIKVAVPMAKGEAPFDAAAATEAMTTINGVPDKFVKLFPAGSDTHPETEASPKIWENMEDFASKANDLKKASAEAIDAAGKGQEAFKTAVFGSLVKTCKACHDAYRIKKN